MSGVTTNEKSKNADPVVDTMIIVVVLEFEGTLDGAGTGGGDTLRRLGMSRG